MIHTRIVPAILFCLVGALGPSCGGEECRDSGIRLCEEGGIYGFDTCGEAALLQVCPCGCASETGGCEPCQCTPDCAGKQCGLDGCGGTCGTCGAHQYCSQGVCIMDPDWGVNCAACSSSTDCRPGLTCVSWDQFPNSGWCSAPCTSDASCGHPSMTCIEQTCAPTLDTICSGDDIHVLDGCGRDIGLWTTCTEPEYCENGACVDPCARCLEENCAVFSEYCLVGSPCETYMDCSRLCAATDRVCQHECVSANFSAAVAFLGYLGCAELRCNWSCFELYWDDIACEGCLNYTCGFDYASCLLDDECSNLMGCLDGCPSSDDACVQDCANSSTQAAIDLYNAFPQCAHDGCAEECGLSTCEPACAGKACGPDGCGGSCGTCASGLTCNNGSCTSGNNYAACNDCLDSCYGLPGCCTGMGCMCQSECATSGECPPGTEFRCGPYGDCYCLPP